MKSTTCRFPKGSDVLFPVQRGNAHMNRLLSELLRRNVLRVAAAYLIVGWLIMQVVSVMTPALNLPEWVDGLFCRPADCRFSTRALAGLGLRADAGRDQDDIPCPNRKSGC